MNGAAWFVVIRVRVDRQTGVDSYVIPVEREIRRIRAIVIQVDRGCQDQVSHRRADIVVGIDVHRRHVVVTASIAERAQRHVARRIRGGIRIERIDRQCMRAAGAALADRGCAAGIVGAAVGVL